MKIYQIFIGFIFCFFVTNQLVGQCDSRISKGAIIINELGNTTISENGEFVEFFVLGADASPHSPVNLSGWIIDDNNASNYFLGNEPGHIRLSGTCFSQMPPGSIILIYNPDIQIEGIDPVNDGMPNEDGVFQLPITSACIEKHNGCPSVSDSSYDCPIDEGSFSGFEYESVWNDYIPMRNLGDGIQVRNPDMEFIHGIYWLVDDFPAGGIKVDVYNTVSTKSIQFIGRDNWNDPDQYLVTNQFSTPGRPNSSENENLLASITAGDSSPTIFEINCADEFPATGLPNPDGVGLVEIISGLGPYTITYAGPISGEIITDCIGTILIPNLRSGSYNISVTDVLGCERICGFFIPQNAQVVYECPDFSDNNCKTDLIQFLQTFYEQEPECEQFEGDICATTSNLNRAGKVAIGTDEAVSGYMLTVKGGVRVDEIRVELCHVSEWCDYVFDGDYPLLPLDSLRNFVSNTHHLPRMISQADILEEKGIELKQVTIQQQEKIEELFLYLLESNAKLQAIKEQVANLRLENQTLSAAQNKKK